jgi:3-phosphoshikimate 1-carboxyvinyltransferase
MKAWISKSNIEGSTAAPSSKSYTIRGLMCGALTSGKSQLINPLGSEDTVAATTVLRKMGISIRQNKNTWTVNGGTFHPSETDLYCGESATTLRFLTALCASVPGIHHLIAGASLSKRPIKPLLDALRQLDIRCISNGDLPPITIEGAKIQGGTVSLPGNISSQFVSALLQIAPFAQNSLTIKLTTPLESRPYVLMTMDAMQWFGITVSFNESLNEFQVFAQKYEPTKFRIEGDWSSASYLLALGALSGQVEVTNLPNETMQGDRMLLTFLEAMGVSVTAGMNAVTVTQAKLKALDADLSDCIDLFPTLAVLAANAQGTSRFRGIERARLKESDRVAAVQEGLTRMGIKVKEEKNGITIRGGKPVPAIIDSRNDHRIAMAFSVLGTITGSTIVQQAECVSKTYPEFWDAFISLGGKVKLDGK